MIETYHKRPNPFVLLLGALIIGAAGYYAWQRTGTSPSEEPDPDVTVASADTALGGTVAYAEGGVEYRRRDGQWSRLEAGLHLEEGDEVETFGDGRAILRLDDGSMLRMSGATKIGLMSLDPERIVIMNERGAVYARVAKLDRSFEVVAAGVTYESLGTSYATFNTESEKGVEVYESKVRVEDMSKNELAVVGAGKRYYVENKTDIGSKGKVTDIPAEKKDDAFIAWNLSEDAKVAVLAGDFATDKEAQEENDARREGSITLVHVGDGKVTWTTDGAFEKGFKVVWSLAAGPTFPPKDGGMSAYVEDPGVRYATVRAFAGDGDYHVRVCAYTGEGCDVYSNEIVAHLAKSVEGTKTDEKETDDEADRGTGAGTSSITLTVLGGGKVAFSAEGKAPQGFKIAWSRDAGPTYPSRPQDHALYVSGGTAGQARLEGFDGAGTYHVRVCEYTGDGCATYSNEATIELEGKLLVDVSAIVLASAGGNKVSWTTTGTASQGFKVVFSPGPSPEYPPGASTMAYYVEAGGSSAWLDAFEGQGDYHVRVCAYTGDGCVAYSNEIVVTLE